MIAGFKFAVPGREEFESYVYERCKGKPG